MTQANVNTTSKMSDEEVEGILDLVESYCLKIDNKLGVPTIHPQEPTRGKELRNWLENQFVICRVVKELGLIKPGDPCWPI